MEKVAQKTQDQQALQNQEIKVKKVNTENGKIMSVVIMMKGKEETIRMSHSEYKKIAEFKNVRFFIPDEKAKFMKKVQSKHYLMKNADGEIVLANNKPYWRYGVKIGNVLVTRAYYFESKETYNVEVVGDIVIQICKNDIKKEQRIIINYFPTTEDVGGAELELKIGGKEREKTIYSVKIPGTKEKIVINKIR